MRLEPGLRRGECSWGACALQMFVSLDMHHAWSTPRGDGEVRAALARSNSREKSQHVQRGIVDDSDNQHMLDTRGKTSSQMDLLAFLRGLENLELESGTDSR